MKLIKKWYRNLRIQRKLLYLALGITLIVLLSASISQYILASRMVLEQTKKQFAGVVYELSINLDHYFELVENSFDYIANNNVVQEELKSDTPYCSDGKEYLSYYSRAGQIRRLLLQGYTSVYMNDIQLYGYNGANHLLSNGNDIIVFEEETVLKKAEEAAGKCVYYNASDDAGVIYVAKQIKDTLTMKPLGILRASIKVDALEKMTEAAQNSFTAEMFLLDKDYNVILNSTDCNISEMTEKFSDISGNFIYRIKNQNYCCVYQKGTDIDFVLVGMAPMSFLSKAARELLKTTIILLVLSVILCVVLTSVLAKGMAGPIENTSNAMKKFAGGDFTVRLPEGRTDEIGEMNSVFNHTIEEVESLLKKIVEMEVTNKDIEFQALQAQINPHFLYNVLDTINWMARKKGEDNICRMVTAISNLMRESISNKKSMVTIQDEMKYVQDYIYIQETRYGDKFTSCIEVDKELNSIQIPKMTIQTLVENAVVHGVENAIWDCFVYVTVECWDHMVVIKIKDNGVGMSKEKINSLLDPEINRKERKPEDGQTHTNLGIYALRKRLDYVYDGNADISIVSREGKGTEITLKIPLEETRRIIIDGTSSNGIR